MAGYTQVHINNDMSKLNKLLQTLVTNGIVGAVDYDDSGEYAVFTLYKEAAKTTEIFKITQSAGTSYTFKAACHAIRDGDALKATAIIERIISDVGYAAWDFDVD